MLRSGLLPEAEAPRLLRVARSELVSVQPELRLLLYGGVLLVTTGAGLLIKENLDRIGPLTVALLLGLAAAAALAWVVRLAPPFSWGAVASPHLAFEYVLLLAVLLAASDLAFVEARWTPLGAAWPWHLLLVAALTGAAAIRYDSRIVFSLALGTFAAWRGVSALRLERSFSGGGEIAVVTWNAIGCGGLFVVLGVALTRTGRKPHFAPIATHLGWLLVLGGLTVRALSGPDPLVFAALLLLTGAGLAWGALRGRRFPLFACGVVGGYVALSRLVLSRAGLPELGCLWFCATAVATVALLVVVQRRMKEAP